MFKDIFNSEIKPLFGNLKVDINYKIFWVGLKVIYLIFSLPIIILIIFEGSGEDEKSISMIKRILFHLANIFISIIFWGFIIGIVMEYYKN